MKKRTLTWIIMVYISFGLSSASNASSLIDGSVSAKWLQQNIKQPNLKIIEMSDASSYEFEGHIPGAIFTNKSDWRYQDHDGSLIHLSLSKLENKIHRLGVNDHDAVILYYKGKNLNEVLGAHYLFWIFHRLGHTQVAMLNQGWHGWIKNGGTIQEENPSYPTGNFRARSLGALEITTSELYAIQGFYNIIDGRPTSHFNGQKKFPANTRYGRLSGSLNQPWEEYLQTGENGLIFIDTGYQPSLLKTQMITPQQPLILTCFGGTGGATNYAMFYINGYRNLRLHDAGLRRWNELNLPLTTGQPH